MTEQDDEILEHKVLDGGLVSREELAQCKARRAALQGKGVNKTLAEILIEDGCLTRSQLTRLNEAMDEVSQNSPDQQIPGYQILERVGHGATATVWKAKQLDMDRIVAVKVLPRRLSENPESVERFDRGVRTVARLSHSNIVQAFAVGQAIGHHCFVMEYVDGHTLYDELAKGKVFGEAEALNIIIQIARALEHAHSRGFIHRDVKPRSIMLTKDNRVKLTNWDLARGVSDHEAAKSEAGRAFGTSYYISPEQIRGELDIDARSDIYSLGATFYHLVTGRYPFDGPTLSAVMHKHLKQPLIPPDHVNSRLSSGIGEIIEVMMAKERGERYSSTRELVIDLEALSKGEPPLAARRYQDREMLEALATNARGAKRPKLSGMDAVAGLAAIAIMVAVLGYVFGYLPSSLVEDVLKLWPVYIAVAAVLGVVGAACVLHRRRRKDDEQR